jgi:regulatory protein
MIVTALESQKKDPSRVNLFVDDNFFCGVSLNTIAKYSLYVGKETSQEILEELFSSELQSRFFERAISFLESSPKTERQIRQYLKDLSFKKKGKWFETLENQMFSNILENVITKLKEYQYIDDEKYAELFISSRLRTRPRGKDILVMELISKGVAKDIAEKVVNLEVEDEYTLLKELYTKKFKDEKMTEDDRKKIDFLRRKGFSWDLIEKYINNEFGNKE